MTTKQEYLDSLVNDFLKSLRKKKRAQVTHDGYRWLIMKVNRKLMAAGFDANPRKWTEKTVLFIKDIAFAHLKPSIARREMSVLNTYAQYHGNSIIKDMDLEWAQDERVHVDWLTPEQALRVVEAAEGMERIIIHLELNLGLRRVEILRLRVQDINMGCVHVCGKGRQGGKWRTVRFHPDTLAELNYWHKLRQIELERAGKDAVDPGFLLVYGCENGKVLPYKRTAVDKCLKAVGKRTGIKFSNHTLRRTFGRSLWLSRVPIESIAQMMGHEDTKTTKDYLGLCLDDQDDAMRKLADFQSAVKYRVGQNTGCESGQSGI